MQAKIKHIVLACSSAGKPAMLQELLEGVPSSITITVADTIKRLETVFRDTIPDIIIILRVKGDDDLRFLDVIRKNEQLDETPVFVYRAIPAKKDWMELLKKWRNAFLYLPL